MIRQLMEFGSPHLRSIHDFDDLLPKTPRGYGSALANPIRPRAGGWIFSAFTDLVERLRRHVQLLQKRGDVPLDDVQAILETLEAVRDEAWLAAF